MILSTFVVPKSEELIDHIYRNGIIHHGIFLYWIDKLINANFC